MRLLIADPEESLLEAYREFFPQKGFEVATAATGPECVRLLRKFAPRVVVLEPELPDRWGSKLLDLIRDAQPAIPVVILTRRDHQPIEPPVVASLIKPVSLTALGERIRSVLED